MGADLTKQVEDLSIEEVLLAPHSPWQRAYIERVIGSIRRECLDHVIVFNRYTGTSSPSWSTITRAERTFRWRRTLRVVDRCNLQSLGE